jgi:hypothetical protein
MDSNPVAPTPPTAPSNAPTAEDSDADTDAGGWLVTAWRVECSSVVAVTLFKLEDDFTLSSDEFDIASFSFSFVEATSVFRRFLTTEKGVKEGVTEIGSEEGSDRDRE